MPQGYLVTLGDTSLDANDYISATQSTFTTAVTIGTGSWNWTGVYEANGQSYSNIQDTGVYYEGTDGNVYFVPDTYMTTSGDAFAVAPPTYDVAGGLTGLTANGAGQVTLSVAQEANFTSSSMETNDALYDFDSRSDTSSIEAFGGASGTDQNAATLTIDFTDPASTTTPLEMEDVSFGIFDIDELQNQFLDQVIITAYDANGVQVPVTITVGSNTTLTASTDANGTATATSILNSGGSGNVDAVTGFIEVNIPGPVASIEIDYNNVETTYGNHAIRIGDLVMTTPSVPSVGAADSIIGGTGDDLIYGQGGDDTIDGRWKRF